MKKIVCLLLCLMALLLFVACAKQDSGKIPDGDTDEGDTDEKITEEETDDQTELPVAPTADISEKIIYLFEGESYKLQYTVSATDDTADAGSAGEDSLVVWTSSNDCVSVKDGTVTAIRDGFSIVSGGGESFCTVRVVPREMPVISITTELPISSKEHYIPCLVSLESTNASFCFEDEVAEIRYRGNSTYNVGLKKAYRIKFTSKQNLLGMNEGAECRSWVLLAEYFDHSLIRNSTCLSLASAIVNEYVSDWRYVRLRHNGMELGVFLLAEQAQINPNRVDIEEAGKDTDALESGYMFEIDQSVRDPNPITIECDDYYFHTLWGRTHKSNLLKFKIENDGLSDEQTAYLQKFLRNSFEVVYRATYQNEFYELDADHNLVKSDLTDPKAVIATVVDLDSLARKYILDELVCNHDSRHKSYYMHVDFSERGTGLLTFSCPWDYDFTMYKWNNTWSNYEYYDPEAFMQAKWATWYVMMLNHEWFREMVTERWNEVYAQTDGFRQQLAVLQQISELYAEDFAYDTTRWERPQAQSVEAKIALDWLTARINWMNETVGKGNYLIKK